ncbi:hypothetical protein F0562_007409 [Nyssa sinensis]|uniref:Uncharacterized protein n=1 Tax=Nyssa sinensis TaxID=561372 RepID=A0A5J5A6B9_9ASTE|nr:hypothetical protein F0562_007409 [Nyssa sinensis]
MAAARPWVSVVSHNLDTATGGAANTLPSPDVMKASIRLHIVNFVHANITKNGRAVFGDSDGDVAPDDTAAALYDVSPPLPPPSIPISAISTTTRIQRFTMGLEAPTTRSLQLSHLHSVKKARLLKDHVRCATNKRRGIIEDLYLAIGIFEEAIFDVVHKAAHCLLSPFDTSKTLLRWCYFHSSGTKDIPASSSDASASTAILGDNKSNAYRKELQFPLVQNTGTHMKPLKALRLEGAGLEWIEKEEKTSLIAASMTLELFNVANSLIESGAI